MNYLEQEDTSMSSSEVIYVHSNWKKKSLFVLVSGSLLTKLFFYSLNIPRGLLRRNNEVKKVRSFPLKKKSNETEQNYCVLLSNACYKTRSLSKSVLYS